MTGLHALTRLAARECRRRPWRSLLVVLFIAVPTAIVCSAAIGFRTVPDSPEEAATKQMGSADLILQNAGGLAVDPVTLLPSGSRVLRLRQSTGVILAGQGKRRFRPSVHELDVSDPLARGLFALDGGRLPTRSGQVLASRSLLNATSASIGDSLTISGQTVTISGSGRWAASPGEMTLIGPSLVMQTDREVQSEQLLVDLPDGTTFTPSPDSGVSSQWLERASFTGSPTSPSDVALLYLFGGLALAAFGLVVASALAVGARRQLRAIGLVGATGASPRQTGLLLLLQGLVLGVVGAGAGVAGGLLLWQLTRPLVERWSGSLIGATNVVGSDLVLISVLALLVAVGAAVVPARLAARTSVLHALGGRRPLSRLGMRFPIVGVALSLLGSLVLARATFAMRGNGGGDGATIAAVAGSALVIAGLVVCAPYLVGLLEPLAGKLSGSTRLAARTLARQRGRTGPTVAAIMATGALAIAAATVAISQTARDTASQSALFPPDIAAVEIFESVPPGTRPRVDCDLLSRAAAPIRKIVPGSATACIESTDLVADGAAVAAIGVDEITKIGGDDLRAVLSAGGLVLAGSHETQSRSVELLSPAGRRTRANAVGSGDTRLFDYRSGGLLMSRDAVTRAGGSMVGGQISLLLRSPAPLSDAQRAAFRELNDGRLEALVAGADPSINVNINFANQYESPVTKLVYAVVLPAAVLLALLVALVGLALTASETRDDQATFVALGAGPRHRRRQNAWQAAIVTGLGALLALPGGFVPAAIVLRAADSGIAIKPPWLVLVVLCVGLPLAAAAGGMLLTRARMSPLIRRSV